ITVVVMVNEMCLRWVSNRSLIRGRWWQASHRVIVISDMEILFMVLTARLPFGMTGILYCPRGQD
ncbi:hypothetical protein EG933_24935, partial [Salmonella enterica]|nr:hypothetical protein [Salmonella enterica]